MFGVVANASNIVRGDNPPYSADDFLRIYPQFKDVPEEVIAMYLKLADSSLIFAKWNEWWEAGMGLYIAHFLTLWLQEAKRQPGTIGTGLVASKSVDGVSVSYDNTMLNNLADWGAFSLTSFGAQLVTLAKMVGMGGMGIR
jgi:hypothetical protein